MITDPVPFREAVEFAAARGLLPTGAGSAEIREWEAAIRRRSLFSARTTHAGYLQDIAQGLDHLLAGETNEASIRAWLQDRLDHLTYDPARGFPGDRDIPPAEPGSLRDLSSDRRIKLLLDTQESMVANFGYRLQGQQELARFANPCWELIRVRTVDEERGDWPERWVRAGGELFDGRMIAPKDHSVWDNLGNSALFEDGLDNPYPPFAFGSGMGVREVAREDCISLGVIEPDEVPEVEDLDLNAELRVNADQFDSSFLDALDEDLRAALANDSVALDNYDPSQSRDNLGRWVSAGGGSLSERDNIRRGTKAARRALSRRADVQRAMNRQGLGEIDFPWGNPGQKARDYAGGFGLSHILAKHGRKAVLALPVVLAKGKITRHPDDSEKREIRHEGYLAVLAKEKSRSAWVLTGFKDRRQVGQ